MPKYTRSLHSHSFSSTTFETHDEAPFSCLIQNIEETLHSQDKKVWEKRVTLSQTLRTLETTR